MKRISALDAFQGMDEVDLKVMDQEVAEVFNSAQRKGRKMTKQFFQDSDGSILLVLYWGNKAVHTLRFNKAVSLLQKKEAVV